MFGEINVSTWAFVDRPVGDALPVIEEAGFGSVEIWGDTPSHFDLESRKSVLSLKDDLSSCGMRPDSLHAPFGRRMDISSPDPEVRKGAVGAVLRYVEAASELGLGTMIIHPGHIMGPGEEPRRYEMATASLEEICRTAEDRDLEVCVENLLGDESHLVFCDTLPKTLHLLRSVEGVSPGLCVDTSHANIMGNVSEDIEICGDIVHRTHISDNFGANDDHLPPGDGEIDWKAVVTSLHRIGYEGPLTLEVAGRGSPREVILKARSSISGMVSNWEP